MRRKDQAVFRSIIASTSFLLLVLFFTFPTNAEIIHVPGDAPTIQDGIDLATPGSHVVIAAGTYHEKEIELKAEVTVRGATGNPADVILDADGSGHIFVYSYDNTPVYVENMTLMNGESGLRLGPYVACELTNCIITGHTNSGVYAVNSQISMRYCLVEANTGTNAGGVYVWGGGGLKQSGVSLAHCRILNNNGSGFVASNCYIDIDTCTITGNDPYGIRVFDWTDGYEVIYELRCYDSYIKNNADADGTGDKFDIVLFCCAVDPDRWYTSLGSVRIYNNDCETTNEILTWGEVKTLYR